MPFGCEEHRAALSDRGGDNVIGWLDDISRIKWNRVRDDISQAEVIIEDPSQHCLEILENIGTNRTEMIIYRGEQRAWEGPLTLIRWTRDRIVLQAKDILHYVYRTAMRAEYNNNYPNTATVVQRAADIVLGEMTRKEALTPPYGVLDHLLVVEGPEGARTSRRTMPYEMTVFEQLDELAARAGLEYTVVGRRLVLFDGSAHLGTTAEVTQDDVQGDVIITEYGMEAATWAAVADGQGGYGATGGADGYYGLIEILDSAYNEDATPGEEGQPVSAAELASQAARNMAGRNPAPLTVRIPDGSQLNPFGTLNYTDLVPGTWVPLRGDVPGRRVKQMMRFDTINFQWDAEKGETITATLSPRPTAGGGTVIAPEPPSGPVARFTAATYNVLSRAWDGDPHPFDRQPWEVRVGACASTVALTDASIIGLQEAASPGDADGQAQMLCDALNARGRNLSPNPGYETNVTTGMIIGAAVTATQVTSSSVTPLQGTYSLRGAIAGAGTGNAHVAQSVTLPAGSVGKYLAVRAPTRRGASATSYHGRARISFYDATSTIIGSISSASFVALNADWTVAPQHSALVPVGAVRAEVGVWINGAASASVAAPDGTIWTDAWTVGLGDTSAEALALVNQPYWIGGPVDDWVRLDAGASWTSIYRTGTHTALTPFSVVVISPGRYFRWCIMQHNATGVQFYHGNTHLSTSVATRKTEVALIIDTIEATNLYGGKVLPVVLTGDWNDTSMAAGHALGDMWAAGYETTKAKIIAPVNYPLNTYNGLDPMMENRDGDKWIDHILVDPTTSVAEGGIAIDFANGVSLPMQTPIGSDHNLVWTTISIPQA